jgi:hypothetical protein
LKGDLIRNFLKHRESLTPEKSKEYAKMNPVAQVKVLLDPVWPKNKPPGCKLSFEMACIIDIAI